MESGQGHQEHDGLGAGLRGQGYSQWPQVLDCRSVWGQLQAQTEREALMRYARWGAQTYKASEGKLQKGSKTSCWQGVAPYKVTCRLQNPTDLTKNCLFKDTK